MLPRVAARGWVKGRGQTDSLGVVLGQLCKCSEAAGATTSQTNPIKHVCRDLKMSTRQRNSSHLTELERICDGRMAGYLQIQACLAPGITPKRTGGCQKCFY